MTKPTRAALLLACKPTHIGAPNKILTLFGDDPDFLEAIRIMRRDQRCSYAHIARSIKQVTGDGVNATTVQKWLTDQGIT